MSLLIQIKKDLHLYSSSQKAKIYQRFFKTGKGEYGEGDKFIGVTVPNIRKVVNLYWERFELSDCEEFLHSPIHEERLCALLILVKKFEKGSKEIRKQIFELYLANTKYINNWDLVDSSAKEILGGFLFKKDRKILEKLVKSQNLWVRRMAILATFYFIQKGDFSKTIHLAKILLTDKENLIQKAAGWMLREIGKRGGQNILEDFLKKNHQKMPRTMLRYAIERFPEKKRKIYLEAKI